VKTYEITLTGETTPYRIRANDLTEAARDACKTSGVPFSVSAVHHWRVVPTARQIARTKNLMRGL
jgi:hypothetical protein